VAVYIHTLIIQLYSTFIIASFFLLADWVFRGKKLFNNLVLYEILFGRPSIDMYTVQNIFFPDVTILFDNIISS